MVKNSKLLDRVSKIKRDTSETKIDVKINLDGRGNNDNPNWTLVETKSL